MFPFGDQGRDGADIDYIDLGEPDVFLTITILIKNFYYFTEPGNIEIFHVACNLPEKMWGSSGDITQLRDSPGNL